MSEVRDAVAGAISPILSYGEPACGITPYIVCCRQKIGAVYRTTDMKVFSDFSAMSIKCVSIIVSPAAVIKESLEVSIPF